MGLLRIKGTIELNQFWPSADSDADTSKVEVNIDNSSFSFAEDEKNFRITSIFANAEVSGTSKGKVVKNNKIKVRLQGIDAPELHFRAPPLRKSPNITPAKRAKYNQLNQEFRQYQAETATVALAKKLSNYHSSTVKCEVFSYVDEPKDVVDTYGRFVGNIRVGKNFQEDINVWLTEEGWVFPAFYSSMSNAEIETLLEASKKGRKRKRVWQYFSQETKTFDYDLQYRHANAVPNPSADVGAVLWPKLFRRQAAWFIGKKVKLWTGNLNKYLEGSPEGFFLTKDFLTQGIHTATMYHLHDQFNGTRFKLEPEDLVLREKFSKLVDAAGEDITSFF